MFKLYRVRSKQHEKSMKPQEKCEDRQDRDKIYQKRR